MAAEWREELGLLASVLCDGGLTTEQATRLEQIAGQSPEARRWLLQYVQLHGELHWDHAAAASENIVPASGPQFPLVVGLFLRRLVTRIDKLGRRRALAAVLAASLLVAAFSWAVNHVANRPGRQPEVIAARIVQTWEAEGSLTGGILTADASVPEGAEVSVDCGLVEFEFNSGARLILEGPARADILSAGRVFLGSGRLTAHAPSAGFQVHTSHAVIVDLGTAFGVSVESDGSHEVHVFDGSVEVHGVAAEDRDARRTIKADQAVRLRGDNRSGWRLEDIAVNTDGFIRSLPSPLSGSVAKLRRLVRNNPHLIHHYTFEGVSSQERAADKQGDLGLAEVVMRDGRGSGSLNSSARGYDPTTNAVAIRRSAIDGNTRGVGLQTENNFHPPTRMTVELLLRMDDDGGTPSGAIRSALATRSTRQRCGFFVAAVDHGQLTHLMDGNESWVESEAPVSFVPGDWYYLAATFRVEAGRTVINTYAANLSRQEELNWTLRNHSAPGMPAASRLGVGKAFDADIAHAYPWSGALDEIAIYDIELDRTTLEEHFEALAREPVLQAF